MSQFVFNDIYGNESAREKYQSDRQYGYFNTILKLHNRYYEDDQMHKYIFSPRKTTTKFRIKQKEKIDPVVKSIHKQDNHQQGQFSYYNVQKLNNITFRISKKNKLNISQHNYKTINNKQKSQNNKYLFKNSMNDANRNIIQDVKYLQNALSTDRHKNRHRQRPSFTKEKQRHISDFHLNQQDIGSKFDKLNYYIINKQYKNLSQELYNKH